MTYTSMRIDRDGGLARLTFIQPQRGNPIDGAFCAEFCDVANELSGDPTVRAVLITAEGKAFSYGGDVGMFLQNLDKLPLMIKRWTADLHMGIARMQRMDAPIVAAVHGICAGGMSGMVAGSDIVVAEPGTRFVAAYAGIGYCNDAGSSIMYTRRMGIARTRRFLLMNETLDAPAALALGLVDEVVPADQLATRAEAIARQLAAGPTKAFGEIRRLLTTVEDQPLEAQMELEAQALSRIAATADAHEGLTAFGEKRKPAFRGE
ncbi:enoyl-CoA hydratase/isomerase family protein [Novosphingobium lentum]|uniref:enoyl-CoA hydratase/isomerase family protein n=1 Tax=Novosphingobium lentum TaxID=145287 RepID=UPI0008345DB8|nr:enoyl-CoA hydratase-related protein [Novosphingobium lentum]